MTAKKELQLAAKRSEELFFKSFHLSPAMMCLISVEKRTVLDVNDAWCFFTGYTKDEVIGQCTDVLTVFSNHYPIDSDVLDSGSSGSRSNFKVKCLTKQGHIRELIHSSEIIEVTGEMCFLYVALDVTENEKLTREIARLDKLNLIGQMAAGIGHEIRNPLTTVRGFLQFMMSKEYFANHSHHFELMISELDRANHIITEFLSLAGYKHYDRQSHNINLLVENIFPLLQSEALKENKNISFLLEDIPKVDINEMEFRQLILNLVKNGFEAIDSGGCVKIQTYSTVHSVVLRIEDTGHGIPSDVLGKLGTPFFTTKSHGTGLGLAVCYSIVERHNGRIDVASNEHGTSFTIHFPLP
ncbi:hypothetical protein BHU72_13085 [Desulfuribacillus stibiiarsenatis]|uniref:histidine kinase n=1 Tax=Desulfuribacillus stibiiarsenatis TaxID=1390249 RepID=A0A1E5L936_9FIRM|nr:hypothetical protein BHU72_13085 [Desulfuribacillus stibiiarsenatis]